MRTTRPTVAARSVSRVRLRSATKHRSSVRHMASMFSHHSIFYPFYAVEDGGAGAAVLDPPVEADEQPAPRDDGEQQQEQHGPTFDTFGLSEPLLESIKAVGYEEPTPIQERVIPVLMEGRDVIAQAQTGSGKTAAFGLPIINAIDPKDRRVQALILCPTRELAIQVSEALHLYGKHKHVETLPIYGGQPYERQLRGLQRGVQIVVGTPGRVMDHMRRGTLHLDDIRFFILDEADEMLDMGFVDDIEWILEQVPVERQTALFSATMPPRIAELATKYLNEPQRISVRGKQMTVAETKQTYYEAPRSRKVDALTRILDAEIPGSAMIFCRTKNGVDELGEALMARGLAVETLHGDLSQAQRDRVMRRFRTGQADILIATDVAARGLDIPDVSHVINYDIPESIEAYVHRVGRTGRAGKSGQAITLITPRESRWLRQIERATKATIEFKKLPTATDVNERRREVLKELVRDALRDEEAFKSYLEPVRELSDEEFDSIDIAAALLKLYAEETGRTTTEETRQDDVANFGSRPPRMEGGPGRFEGGQGRYNDAGMVRLVFNIGRDRAVRPQDFVGAIANEANVPGRIIGAIDIFDDHTFVDVPGDAVQQVLGAMNHASIKGRPVQVEVSNEPAGSSRGRPGPGPSGFRGGRSGERRYAPAGARPHFSGNRRPQDDGRGPRQYGGGPSGGYRGNRSGGYRRERD